MSDNKNLKDRIDPFSEYFRQRLINKPTYPDENCWDEIEARLPKKRAISPVWIGLAIAASVITAVFILKNTIYENKNSENNEVSWQREVVADKETHGDEIISDEEGVEEGVENTHKDAVAEAKIKRKLPIVTPIVRKDAVVANEKETDDEHAIVVDGKNEKNKADIKADDSEKNAIEPKEESEEKNPIVEKGKEPEVKKQEETPPAQGGADKKLYRSFENLTANNVDYNRRKKRSNNWQIQAGLNSISGNSRFFNHSGDLPMAADPNDQSGIYDQPKQPPLVNIPEVDFEKNYNSYDNIPKEWISEKNYSIPLSLGITVRKRLNEKLGFETGLVYSYLSTGFVVKGSKYYTAGLDLHYLGVPVNLIVNIWDKKQWNIYASGGGMVEKGLQSVFTKKGALVYENLNSKEKSSISGLQWSMNGGIGLSYNFLKDISLYVEPGFSYYFDCNQPMSKRTEDPFIFSLKVGLRYDF